MLDFSKNYFELFGLPVGYVVDVAELASRYRELQRIVHPDRYASASDQEKRLSMQGATLVNEAYQVLRDPIARARYLLSLHGGDSGLDTETTNDAGFLMEQLELREELESARDHADPARVVADLIGRIDAALSRLTGQVALQFEAATPDQLEEAREGVRKMQFLQRLRDQAEDLEAELDEA